MKRLISLVAFAVVIGTPCFAQQVPSVEEIVGKLRPMAPAAGEPMVFRGVRVEGGADPAKPAGPPSIDLSVNFEFGSARLGTDELIVLDNLGRALNDATLKTYRFMVAGHTDGVGRPEVNLRLSQARAEAVVVYLVRRHGIARDRLVARGFGATQLLDPANPADSTNRRVQVTRLEPNS